MFGPPGSPPFQVDSVHLKIGALGASPAPSLGVLGAGSALTREKGSRHLTKLVPVGSQLGSQGGPKARGLSA